MPRISPFLGKRGREDGPTECDNYICSGKLASQADLAVENLSLRQQVAVLTQSVKRPKLRPHDHFFWACLSGLWPDWKSALILVQPETVIRWHRQGFKLLVIQNS